MANVQNKEDYLKKYLSGSKKDKKKRRIVTSLSSIKKSRIVDDDIDISKLRPIDENELDIYDLAEDAPQIAGIIDDRPEDVKIMSEYRETKKWKVVTREYEDVKVSAIRASDSDASSPQRRAKGKSGSDSDISVKRKEKRHDSDESPPRRSKPAGRSKIQESKKERHNSDDDLSPPRKSRKTYKEERVSEKRVARGSDSDLSPPRSAPKKHGREAKLPRSSEDLSPPRKSKYGGKHDTQEDSHRRHWGKDTRIPENRKVRDGGRDDSKRHESRDKHDRYDRKVKSHEDAMKKTLDGKKAGLQNATEMKKEADILRKKQAESLAQLGDDESGRRATAIMRDKKTGRIRDFKEEARQKREKDAKAAEIVEKYAVWGKGVKQIEDRTEKMKSDLHEMSKPVARYADDEDLEEMRRNEEKEGDPMLEYIRNKRKKEGKGGAVKKQYQGAFNPNRFNIKPGHRWDGVDRSNGYEKQWFEEKSNRKALEEEAFKWSTEDM